jgi:hypothetical protein
MYDYLADSWNHTVILEEVLSVEEGAMYPVCMDGRRACPPEHCGGVPGYYQLVRDEGSHT